VPDASIIRAMSAPCILVEVDWRFRDAMTHRPDDGGSKHPRNVGKLLSYYTVQQSRRQSSSYSPPWERKFSLRSKEVRKDRKLQEKSERSKEGGKLMIMVMTMHFEVWDKFKMTIHYVTLNFATARRSHSSFTCIKVRTLSSCSEPRQLQYQKCRIHTAL
jgi:hypothetical protein